MPRIKMVRGLVGEDRTDWLPGTEHEASVGYADYLVSRGKAVYVTAAPKQEAAGLDTENAAPVNRMQRAPRRR